MENPNQLKYDCACSLRIQYSYVHKTYGQMCISQQQRKKKRKMYIEFQKKQARDTPDTVPIRSSSRFFFWFTPTLIPSWLFRCDILFLVFISCVLSTQFRWILFVKVCQSPGVNIIMKPGQKNDPVFDMNSREFQRSGGVVCLNINGKWG